MTEKVIDSFKGENSFLSNFYYTHVVYKGNLYPSSEHAYQAAKTHNSKEKDEIRTALTPARAKFLSRFCTKRHDWKDVKLYIMKDILLIKFSRPLLKEKLDTTKGFKLIEGNNWGDIFWGVCDGVGENHLGRLLMEIRDKDNV